MKSELESVAKPALQKSLERLTDNWKTKVKWVVTVEIQPNKIQILGYTENEKFAYVEEGTDSHTIVPKKASWLRFRTNYVAKTLPKPGRLNPSGGVSTGPEVYAKAVNHPGSEGRHLTKEVAKDFEPDFRRFVENIFRQIARAVEE